MRQDKSYLAVLQWPDSLGERERAQAVAHASGLDLYHAELIVRRGTPQIIARLDAQAAELGARSLHQAGAMALAIAQSAMTAAAPARRLKRLVAAEGAPEPMYACEFWRDEPAGLRMAEVFLMVRAHLRSTETRTSQDRPGPNPMVFGGLDAAVAGAMVGNASATKTSRMSVTEVLDLWLNDGSRLRIDADHFNFDVLGSSRGPTGRENLDALTLRLRRQAPRAVVDQGFGEFRCPPEYVKSHFIDAGDSAVKRTSEMPAFEFYSTWSYLTWRAMTA